MQWLAAPTGPVRAGLYIDPSYAHLYAVDVAWLDVWADQDRDGLSDAEEASLGTSPDSADTDKDGVNDWDDLRPLDPAVGFVPYALFCNKSTTGTHASALTFKVGSSPLSNADVPASSVVSVTVNNTANALVDVGCMRLPRFPACRGCVAVAGENRSLSCGPGGEIVDGVPMQPLGRRVRTGLCTLPFVAGVILCLVAVAVDCGANSYCSSILLIFVNVRDVCQHNYARKTLPRGRSQILPSSHRDLIPLLN